MKRLSMILVAAVLIFAFLHAEAAELPADQFYVRSFAQDFIAKQDIRDRGIQVSVTKSWGTQEPDPGTVTLIQRGVNSSELSRKQFRLGFKVCEQVPMGSVCELRKLWLNPAAEALSCSVDVQLAGRTWQIPWGNCQVPSPAIHVPDFGLLARATGQGNLEIEVASKGRAYTGDTQIVTKALDRAGNVLTYRQNSVSFDGSTNLQSLALSFERVFSSVCSVQVSVQGSAEEKNVADNLLTLPFGLCQPVPISPATDIAALGLNLQPGQLTSFIGNFGETGIQSSDVTYRIQGFGSGGEFGFDQFGSLSSNLAPGQHQEISMFAPTQVCRYKLEVFLRNFDAEIDTQNNTFEINNCK